MKCFESWFLKYFVFYKCAHFLSALFKILVVLPMTLFSEKMLNSHRCIHGLMPNLIKKSWTVSNPYIMSAKWLGGWVQKMADFAEGTAYKWSRYLYVFTPSSRMAALFYTYLLAIFDNFWLLPILNCQHLLWMTHLVKGIAENKSVTKSRVDNI